jgi:haloalkane dehalogenase
MEPITPPEVRPAWLPDAVWPYPLGSLTAGARRVVYTDTGGPGPVLLFVHVGLWSLMWKGTIGNLSGRYRCVTLDVPGSGLSDRTARAKQTLDVAAEAIGVLIDRLELDGITLVVHDLGGLAALAAARTRLDRVAAVVAVSTFAWKPRGVMLPVALRFMGSAMIREIAAFTGFMPRASSTALGVGRRWDRATRQAWRAGLRDRASRRLLHRLFRDAARNTRIQQAAEAALAALTDRPLITVFGQLGDYFAFQRQWRRRHPTLQAVVVPRGLHFPMCDNPELVAAELVRRLKASASDVPGPDG